MTQLGFDPHWLQALRARASRPPANLRQALWLNGQRIGSVAPGWLAQLLVDGYPLRSETFALAHTQADADAKGEWHISGNGTQALAALAQACWAADVGHVRAQWRNELLPVFGTDPLPLASVERGLARLLGVATRAVHLVGYAPNGGMWVQQRAHSKAIDPGLWDTLVGGLVTAADNLTTALVRETWEEAGLALDQVQQLRAGGRLHIQQPNAIDGGLGYVDEQLDWFCGLIPDGLQPVNQDGEVAQFALLAPLALKARLESGAFTLDAALILSSALSQPA